MALAPVSSPARAAADPAAAGSGPAAVDNEQRFLKLLVTQLNNQDPLNPMQNAELTSQLAQMSTVTGIERLNTALQSMLTQSGFGQVLQAASMIGRTVLVPGQQLQLSGDAPARFGIETTGPADAVTVDILDRSGAVVRRLDLGAVPAGSHPLAWDGRDGDGKAVPEGSYRLAVSATQAGAAVGAQTLVFDEVRSVGQGVSGITLDTARGSTALSAVRLIQ